MKKIILAALVFLTVHSFNAQVNSKLFTYTKDLTYDKQKHLSFITFKESPEVLEAEVPAFINSMFFAGTNNSVAVFKTERDEYGFSHTKYSILQNEVPVFNKIIIAHCKNGKLVSLNGDLYPFSTPTNKFSLTEKTALAFALKKVHAKKYKWEDKAEENHMREVLNKPDFTYYPKGLKVIYEKAGKVYNAYQFDIYAEKPLYRANVFVDAASGKILAEQSLICNIDVPGVAATKYSGTQTLTCDQNGGSYRLKETARGLGIETYNLNHATSYTGAVNFTNTATTWTNWASASTASNQAATDAHWGAESTYDYFMAKFNRNSIDNAGYKLLSYVHYNNNYNNAFWDGIRMTYGDGNGTTFTILTALDVCGHEITHGLVNNTANLGGTGTDECDALNEGFADIFGTSVERYARPSNWNWIMGRDITPNNQGIRNMLNPKLLNDPDTYTGQYWDLAGEPHNNAGPCIKWFYLLVNGGAATNDLLNAYNVTGIGNVDAEKIAYRALTVYFTPNTNYAAARVAAIQAAKDLFGDCSNQVQQTARAWYAVGVGSNYTTNVVGPDFQALVTNYCTLPATVNFNNTTSNGQTFSWAFGDGSTATSTNAVHTYTANGTYSVKLKATGCANAVDSITKPSFIVISVPPSPFTTGGQVCGAGTVALNATGTGTMTWFTSPFSNSPLNSGNTFVTPNLNSNTVFYVANSIPNSPVIGGKLTNTGGGYLNNNTQWLNFDVLQNSILNSVVVYVNANTGGNRTVELRNNGTILNTTTFSLAPGANTLTLNYPLTTGTNYELGLSSTSAANLYRSTTGLAFPYNIGSCVSITGSSSGYYYWYYNWSVSKADCMSPAVAVTASVLPFPVASISAPLNVFCSGDLPVVIIATPPGGTLTGQNVSGNVFNPVITGNSAITYTYVDSNGCSDTSSISMQVVNCTGINALNTNHAAVGVFPNPATDHVVVKNEMTEITLSVFDASGRLMLTKQIPSGEQNLELNGFAKGLYLLSIADQPGNIIKTVKLVKQ